jgi:NAD-dependent oxidoreductase involved in siderophore biosynthesis
VALYTGLQVVVGLLKLVFVVLEVTAAVQVVAYQDGYSHRQTESMEQVVAVVRVTMTLQMHMAQTVATAMYGLSILIQR